MTAQLVTDALIMASWWRGQVTLQLRRKANREEHDDAPAELMKWVWAGGRKLKGLARRRGRRRQFINDN